MAKHGVNMNIPSNPLSNNDVEFAIFKDDSKLGTLKVSRGSLEWLPKNSKKNGIHMKWTDLRDLMELWKDKRKEIKKLLKE